MKPFISGLATATQFDPVDSSEGSLDPLGVSQIAGEIATAIGSDGVRERQSNLRFLTICCVGWEVIAGFTDESEESVGGDPNATLEQCVEWIVVEALTSLSTQDKEFNLQGLPGSTKALSAIARGLHLNADRYLRTASVFGFFGVYRTLAEYLELVNTDSQSRPILCESGVRLLEAWRKECKLPGFGHDREGQGQTEYKKCVETLQKTWASGEVIANKETFKFIQKYLRHDAVCGKGEALELKRVITDHGQEDADTNRREVLSALSKSDVKTLLQSKGTSHEFQFHKIILPTASAKLKLLIEAAQHYEAFITALQGIFDDLLYALSEKPSLVEIATIAKTISELDSRVTQVPSLFQRARSALSKLDQTNLNQIEREFTDRFHEFSERHDGIQFLCRLLTHHEAFQRGKSREGKAPWIEHHGDKIAVRLRYKRTERALISGQYLRPYRMWPLYNFLESVKEIHAPKS